MIELFRTTTKDNLILQGIHFVPQISKNGTCVLFMHGIGGNFVDYYFAEVLGKVLSNDGYGFIFFHNRGFNTQSELPTTEINEDGGYVMKKTGSAFEKPTECSLDFESLLSKIIQLGYTNVILFGHSLGVKKVIYFFSQCKPKIVSGLILASPADLGGIIHKMKADGQLCSLVAEAKQLVACEKPLQLLSKPLLGKYWFSAQTLLDHFDSSFGENLPLMNNPEHYEQLETINVPLLLVMGENDFVAYYSPQEDLELLRKKAVNTETTTVVIPRANHMYHRQEEVLSNKISSWIQRIIK